MTPPVDADTRVPLEHYEHLRLRCEAMERAVRHYWDNGVTCPCGARPGSPNTHSHVMGCPVGAVLGGTVADLYDKAVADPTPSSEES